MDNNIIPPTTIIPTAGFIPKKPDKKRPINKKLIIVIAAISVAIILIVAAVAIIIGLSQQSRNTNDSQEEVASTTPTTPEEPKQPQQPQEPETASGDADYLALVSKSTAILSHGAIINSNKRSFSAAVYYTNDKPSSYFGNLTPNHKMAIVISISRSDMSDQTLTNQQAANLGSESCQLLFGETNCRANSSNITPNKWKVLGRSNARIKQEYLQLFGSISQTSKRLIDTCPYYSYIAEIDRYVYRSTCPKKNYNYLHFYQNKYQSSGNKAYIYFAGGSTAVNHETDRYALLYEDIDATSLIDKSADGDNFMLSKNNYLRYARYRLLFEKDSNGNYIFRKFEITDN